MRIFIDTASIEEIKKAHSLGILDGVTTNPSLMAKEGITGKDNIMDHYKRICEIVDGDVSAEVISTDFEGMCREGEELSKLHDNIIVKVPMTVAGVQAINYLYQNDIPTNRTLVFSAAQAILAAKAGAYLVSPFIGRIDDTNWDGITLIHQIAEIYAIHDFETEILAASIRSSKHIVECAQAGADVVTCPLSTIMGLFKHPLTDIGLEKFLEDYRKGNA